MRYTKETLSLTAVLCLPFVIRYSSGDKAQITHLSQIRPTESFTVISTSQRV